MTSAALPGSFERALAASGERLGPFGACVRYFPSVGSTNDVLATLAAGGAPHGTIIVADAQTAGRGRSGRTWFSPSGAGLYVSVLLRPGPAAGGGTPAWVRLITLAAGVALVDGLRVVTGLRLDIKWPNDVVALETVPEARSRGWRKVAGILAEGQTEGDYLRHVVLGYGINIRDTAYPPEIAARAASLEGLSCRPVDRAAVLVETLAALRQECEALPHGPPAALLHRWRTRSRLSSGAPVAWEDAGGRHEGVSAGITVDGSLLVQGATGLRVLSAGEVVWL